MGPEARYAIAGLGTVMLVYGMGVILRLRWGQREGIPRESGVLRSRTFAWAALAVGLALVAVSLFAGDISTTRPPAFLE